MDLNKISTAATAIDKPEGIKVADIVIKLGLTPDQYLNREVSKALSILGWKKGDKKLKDISGRYYLWFSPEIKTINVNHSDYLIMKEERSQFLKEKRELHAKLDKATIELSQMKARMYEDMEKIRERASIEQEGTLKPQKEEMKEEVRLAEYDKIDAFFKEYKDTEDTKEDWESDFERRIKNRFIMAE